MYLILSPAKSLDFDPTDKKVKTTAPLFDKETKLLVDVLKKHSQKDIKDLMHLSDNLAALNYERYQDFYKQPEKMALLAFTGDVYKGLDAPTLSDQELDYAGKHIGILSGLFGLLRASDVMRPYRLEMGTSLSIDGHKHLYDFWGYKIAVAINKEMERVKASHLVNLASNEYYKAVNKKTIAKPIIDIDFKEIKGNQPPKTIGIYAKKARGMMARYVVENKIENIESLQKFNIDGYGFSKADSSDKKWVFLRTH